MKTQEELFAMFDHFVDSHHGVYSAQVFAQSLDFKQIEGMTIEDWNILLAGPDHEHYTDVWADLENITVVDQDGNKWLVYQNEGIFLYPESISELIDWDELNS
jgi:hypothetical protein